MTDIDLSLLLYTVTIIRKVQKEALSNREHFLLGRLVYLYSFCFGSILVLLGFNKKKKTMKYN